MTRYRITAPVRQVSGQVAGVVFVESVAVTDSTRALAYFRRHGYGIEEVVEPEPVVADEAPTEPGSEEPDVPVDADPPADPEPTTPPAEAPAPAKAAKAAKTSTGGTA